MSTSKKSAMKQRRLQQRRKERQMVFLAVAGAVLVLIAIVVGASLIQQNQPVGEIKPITPVDRPNPSGTAMGNPDAPVRIEVFEDFQCPACQLFTKNVEPLIMQELVSAGIAYYVFRHYPFLDDASATRESDQAAYASLCAADQDRFWDYHDIIFNNWDGENQGAYANKRLVAFAELLGLDMDSFNTCFKDNRFKSVVEQDLREGKSMGVTGTPSVFVNGQVVNPGLVPSFEDIKAAVEAALAAGSG